MLTTRGWWFLITVGGILALGLVARLPLLVPISLALLLWFAGIAGLFYLQARLWVRRLKVVRTLRDDRGPIASLWAGRPFQVEVELRLEGFRALTHVAATDRVPFAAELLKGEVETAGPLTTRRPLTLSYRLQSRAPGRLRFEGVRLRLADLQGFFFLETFQPAVVLYRVLPPLADAGGKPATSKRHNLLPPPGIHRLRRPGSGSELLDLRDYLPGDPPRTIAWKVSARRGRLITKEFESEVPLRCTLFLDTSNSVRVGPPGKNALARLVSIAAAVAQANTANRDMTGLCLFDERQMSRVAPARTPRHLVQLLNQLADAAGQAPTTGRVSAGTLLPLAHAFAREVYPDLLRRDLNHVPFWLPWLFSRPAWTLRHPSLAERLYGRFRLWLLFLVGLGGALCAGFLAFILEFMTDKSFLWSMALVLAGWFGLLVLFRKVPILLPRQRRQEVWRKQLAALLSARYGLAPGGQAALQEDEELMAFQLQRFLAEHQVPYVLPLYDAQGQYQFAAPEKVDVLARALLQAVSRGHDNELYVLFADLLELADRLHPLLQAVRVALARHHRVMLFCPWPPGLRMPDPGGAAPNLDLAADKSGPAWLEAALSRTTAFRFQRAFHEVRRTFTRLGVPVMCAANDESVQLILDRLDRLRLLGQRR